MANVNDPDGFTPAYHMSGGTIRPAEFAIASGTNASIFSGDVVGRSNEAVTATTSSGIALIVGFPDKPSNSIGQYARMYVTFPASVFGNS